MSLTELLEGLHSFTRPAHIGFGIFGLLCFWIPMLTAKGQKAHRRFGKIFEVSAWLVILFAALGVINYLIGFSRSEFVLSQKLSEFSLILMLGHLTITASVMLYQGRHALRYKSNVQKSRTLVFLILHSVLLLSSLGLVVFTLKTFPPSSIIALITSLFGLAVVKDGYQFVKQETVTRETWICAHLNGMVGVGLAFYVAFGVFGSKFLFGTDTEEGGWINALPWALPILIIVPIMVYWEKRVRNELD